MGDSFYLQRLTALKYPERIHGVWCVRCECYLIPDETHPPTAAARERTTKRCLAIIREGWGLAVLDPPGPKCSDCICHTGVGLLPQIGIEIR